MASPQSSAVFRFPAVNAQGANCISRLNSKYGIVNSTSKPHPCPSPSGPSPLAPLPDGGRAMGMVRGRAGARPRPYDNPWRGEGLIRPRQVILLHLRAAERPAVDRQQEIAPLPVVRDRQLLIRPPRGEI